MAFQIDSEEFDSTIETKQGEVYAELLEAKKKLEYYEDQYHVELQVIERRKKNLLWTIGIQIGVIIALIILILIISLNLLFGFVAIIIIAMGVIYLIYSTIRCIASWGYHVAKFDAKSHYTLEQEKKDILQELNRVREDMHKLDVLLKQRSVWNPEEDPEVTMSRTGEAFQEQGRKLLDEIALELIFKERRADFLYGEIVR